MTGRALAFPVTVTTDATTITVPTCAPFRGGGGSTDIPTLSEWAQILMVGLLVASALWVLDRVGHDRLILSACHPLYSASHRYVVFARLESVKLPGARHAVRVVPASPAATQA